MPKWKKAMEKIRKPSSMDVSEELGKAFKKVHSGKKSLEPYGLAGKAPLEGYNNDLPEEMQGPTKKNALKLKMKALRISKSRAMRKKKLMEKRGK